MGWRRKQPKRLNPYAKELAEPQWHQRIKDIKKPGRSAWKREVIEDLQREDD